MPDTTSTTQSGEVPEDLENPRCFLDPDVPRTTEESASSISPLDRREAEQEMGSDEDPVDLLGLVWESSPVDSKAYVELVIRCIQLGNGSTSVGEIDEELELSDDLPPLTKVPAVSSVLSIDHEVVQVDIDEWIPQCTTISLGPTAEKLDEYVKPSTRSKEVADAVEWLVETGDSGRIAEQGICFDRPTTGPTHTPPNPPGGPGHPGENRPQGPGPRVNDVNIFDFAGLFATPPRPRLSRYRGRFEPNIDAVLPRTPRGILRTPRGNSGRETRSLADLDIQKERELLQRSPLGSVPRKAFSKEACEEITDWRPIISESEPLAAMLQLILTTDRRDDNADTDQPCTGMQIWHDLILRMFGFGSRQQAYRHGVTTRVLIQLYQKHVDSDFHVSGWDERQNRARVVLAHSIPPSIIQAVDETMYTPNEPDEKVRLISGDRVLQRGNFEAQAYRRREKGVEDHDPAIPLPDYVKPVQDYLNGLRRQLFAAKQHRFLENIDRAFEAAHEISDDRKRRQMIRRLGMIREHEKPLYKACDFFPRLKAEKYNQLMNLPSGLLRALYKPGRDAEVDLSKAHLACTVPVAERNGIEVDLLRQYLDRNLEEEDFDLWMDVAGYFDVEDMKAARKTAKCLYSVPYGSSENNTLREMRNAYEKGAGTQAKWAQFEPVLDHPLVDELFRIREGLRKVIDDRGYLVDAAGREIRTAMMTHKSEDEAWKTVLAYTNASFEQKLMWPVFREAIEEQEWASEKSHRRPKLRVWLYQADGVTIRFGSKASAESQIARLQDAVAQKADELGVPTELEKDYPED